MRGLLEIMRTRIWMISPDFAHAAKVQLQSNINARVPFDTVEKRCGQMFMPITGETFDYDKEKKSVLTAGGQYSVKHMTDPFVDVLYATGPITRGGDDCTYGSADLRDQMMIAADNLNCIGHIFYIDTPGGSAWSINDFKQGIEYAKSKKQPCLAFIDGMCASAGMYLASQCEERYFMHPKDTVGCVGVMAAFYTEKDGSHNEYTNEDYHELYDPESFDKNKWARDIANDDNSELLIADLTKLGKEFRSDMKKSCPKCTDEQLHGKTFDAGETVGTLMTAQNDFGGVCNRLVELSANRGNAAAKQVQKDNAAKNEGKGNITNSNKNMKTENNPKLAGFLGVEEFQVGEEGATINTPLISTMEQKIDKAEADAKQVVELQGQVDAKQKEVGALTESITAKDTKIAELTASIEALNKEKSDAKAAADKAMADKQKELEAVQATVKEDESKMAEKDGTIADLNSKIEALQTNPGNEPAAGGQPASNGSTGAGKEMQAPVWDSSLSASENKAKMQEYQANLNKINANR